MGLLGIQIISVVFIFFMMYVVQIHYRKGELPRPEAIFWYLSLATLAFIVIIPDTAQFLTRTFSVTRLMDLIVITALMITFYMLISMRIEIHKLKLKLEERVRDQAIKSAKSK